MKKIFGGLTILLIAGLVLAGCSNPAGGTTSVARSPITITAADLPAAVKILKHATPSDRTNASGPKITSNGNNSAFPGINFIFDNGNYSGYLKVQKDVFKYYSSFTLTVKASSDYYDYKVKLQSWQKDNPRYLTSDSNGASYYMFYLDATENGHKVNMVFIPNYSLVAPVTFEVQFYDRNQKYMFSQFVENGDSINWLTDPNFGALWSGGSNGTTTPYTDLADLYNGDQTWNDEWAVPQGYVHTGNWCKLGDNTNVYIKTGEYDINSPNYPPTKIHESVKLWPQIREVISSDGDDSDIVPPPPVEKTVDLAFIGYYYGDSGNVQTTSIYWVTLKEGDSINWNDVKAAYDDYAAQGGLLVDVNGMNGWYSSGAGSKTWDGIRPDITFDDFSADMKDTYYQSYYIAPKTEPTAKEDDQDVVPPGVTVQPVEVTSCSGTFYYTGDYNNQLCVDLTITFTANNKSSSISKVFLLGGSPSESRTILPTGTYTRVYTDKNVTYSVTVKWDPATGNVIGNPIVAIK